MNIGFFSTEKKGPRWPLITHLNFLDDPSKFFLSLLENNLQEFLYVCTVQVTPQSCLLTVTNFKNNF